MKIINIMVNELPKSCYMCQFSGDLHDMGNLDCLIINESVIDFTESRHEDCPLKTDYDKYCHCIKCDPNSFEKFYQDDDDEEI